ncbi:Protein gts1 [Polyrhizophydium stewartii]|uniref:Protein gts1 n=1 Tax=Polyrhizophydium stewartii TaxID=2732419 RepID=A0ABR4N8F5_9FUNG|nr:hypothetical protein HK105_006745 [Polyrhizophydium stewartii]
MSGSINPNEDFAGQLKVLASMGFTDMPLNRRALRQSMGRVNQAIDLIVAGEVVDDTPAAGAGGHGAEDRPLAEMYVRTSHPGGSVFRPVAPGAAHQQPPQDSSLPMFIFPVLDPLQQDKVLQLAGLGFNDEGRIRHALHKSKWNVEVAAGLLLEDYGSLDSGFSGTPLPSAGGQVQFQYRPQQHQGQSHFQQPHQPHQPHQQQQQPYHHPQTQHRSADPYSALRSVQPTERFSYTSGPGASGAAVQAAPASHSSAHNPFGGSPSAARSPPQPSLPARPAAAISSSNRYTSTQKQVLTEFDPFSDDNRI